MANLMDLQRAYFGAQQGESLNDAVRRYYGLTAANYVDGIKSAPWYQLGGDALVAFFSYAPPVGNFLALEDGTHFLLEDGSGAVLLES